MKWFGLIIFKAWLVGVDGRNMEGGWISPNAKF